MGGGPPAVGAGVGAYRTCFFGLPTDNALRWYAGRAAAFTSLTMCASRTRPTNLNEAGRGKSSPAGFNPGSLAYYLDWAPKTTAFEDVVEAWHHNQDPTDLWGEP
jgi:hypothetical protein